MSAAQTQTAIPTAFLVGKTFPHKIRLDGETLVGRETGLKADGISRRHCMVRYQNKRFYVADVNSRYGTFLNGHRLQPNEWHRLNPGDELVLGGMDFELDAPITKASSDTAVTKKERAVPMPLAAREAARPNTNDSEDNTEHKAGYGIRFLAWLADAFLGSILNMGLIFVLHGRFASLIGTFIVLGLLDVLPLAKFGWTPGMKIFGLKLIRKDGEPVTWKTAAFRDIAVRFGGFLLMGAVSGVMAGMMGPGGGLMIFVPIVVLIYLTKLHGEFFWDKIAKTRVLRDL
jgi:uncharacterized RDD family membrane protein YckC